MDIVDLDQTRVAGALDRDVGDEGVTFRRVPPSARHQIVDPALRLVVAMPAGVRLEFRTDATALELDVMTTLLQLGADAEPWPATFDLVVGGQLAASFPTLDGTRIVVDPTTNAVEFRPGGPTTVRFDGLPGEPGTRVELWLPQAAVVEVRQLRVNDRATVEPAPAVGPRWIHYGSSISHCLEADRPTGAWPVVAARLAGLDLQSFAFAGQCMLDQVIARAIRDLPADVITMKVGINVVNADAMRERTFITALHGFLDTVRDGHPTTPIAVVTPIVCPPAEEHPGPTFTGADGLTAVVPRPAELAVGALHLRRIRELITDVVAARQAFGDRNLHPLDGIALFGPDDVDDLPDRLHPNAAGYLRMGERFHAMAFAPGAVLADALTGSAVTH